MDDDEWDEYRDPSDYDEPLRPACTECGAYWGHKPGCDVAREEADWLR
ncbi:hypothetical protein ACIBCA_37005 [Kitasatospora sp. NPDC051170]